MFPEDFPHARHGAWLLARSCMSGGKLDGFLEAISAKGSAGAACCAVADMSHGPLDGRQGIEFARTQDGALTIGDDRYHFIHDLPFCPRIACILPDGRHPASLVGPAKFI